MSERNQMRNVGAAINEMALYFPCALCGAEPQDPCHVQGQPSKVNFYPHKMRTQRLWNLFSAGFQAGNKSKRHVQKTVA
jgi:hypothetical protein